MKKKLTILTLLIIALVAVILINNKSTPPASTATESNPQSPAEKSRVEFVLDGAFEIEHDYNQDRLVAIKNHGPGMAKLRLKASSASEDLLVGFVGRGTTEWHENDTTVGIPAGETWQFPLLLHADRSSKSEYIVQLEATQADGTVSTADAKVKVVQAKLNLSVSWEQATTPQAQARLSRWLVIHNQGNTAISDLSIGFQQREEQADHKIVWDKMIEEQQLPVNGSIRLKVSPRLYPTFSSLKGDFVISGINQQQLAAYQVTIPKGKQVFVTLSRTTRSSSTEGKRCTNRPESSYSVPATEGTGGDWTPSPYSGGSTASGRGLTTGSNNDNTEDQTKPEEEKKKKARLVPWHLPQRQ